LELQWILQEGKYLLIICRLVVPSIRNVESKSILEIAADLSRFKDLGSSNSFSPSDLKPSTITLSNIGNIGGTVLHPVIVQGQVCIGGIGKLSRLPRFVGSTLEIKESYILNVSFNADHRVIDGATMAKFVSEWKKLLETPSLIMLNLK
jgi:2-oxoisovalerate dehydrogenase E2 component (dihydrolipoyl transacylase)